MAAVRLDCACHSIICGWTSRSNRSSVMFEPWPTKYCSCSRGHRCLALLGARGNASIRSTSEAHDD
eukprot:11854308-Heterocapsa_arctica.AAC.1